MAVSLSKRQGPLNCDGLIHSDEQTVTLAVTLAVTPPSWTLRSG